MNTARNFFLPPGILTAFTIASRQMIYWDQDKLFKKKGESETLVVLSL
jgi:hypothetical protein